MPTIKELNVFRIANRYYFFSDRTLDWYTAKAFCDAVHMRLYAIETKAENDAVYQYIVARKLDSYVFWTGGYSISVRNPANVYWASTGQWRVPGQTAYQNLSPGEPNSGDEGFGEKERCIAVSGQGFGEKWNDLACSLKFRFICERYPISEMEVRFPS